MSIKPNPEGKEPGRGHSGADAMASQEIGRNVWVLTISMFFLSVSYTMLLPFLPVFLLKIGADESNVALWSGAVFSITFLIAAIMAPIWGRIADRRGKKLMAVRAAACLAIGYGLCGLVTAPWQLFAVRAFLGFANGFLPAGMSLVSLSVPQEKVGKALGIYQTGVIVGGVVGPLLGGLMESWVGMRPAFLLAGLVLSIVTVAVIFLVKEPKLVVDDSARNKDDSSLWEDIKEVRLYPKALTLLWIALITQAVLNMLSPIMALYIGKLRGTMEGVSTLVGIVLSSGGLAGALASAKWGTLGQRNGYFKIMSMAILGTGAFIFCQYFASRVWGFGALQILVGIFTVGIAPLISAALAATTPPSYRGRIFGLFATFNQLGGVMGPMVAAVITTYVGIQYVFLITGLSLGILGVSLYRRYVLTGQDVS